ncbi:MAG: YegS/Rv2252/BmrU family lipid kinase [Clostridia bacterium]|nr:YegS/Rv2252/BmrU family lipid kinase [Clostridia bacterium]
MKCLFIFNPKSGKGKIVKKFDYIYNQLKTFYNEVECYETKASLDAYKFLLENAKHFDVIVISGGDGTLSECVSAIAKTNTQIKIGYIPSGTVNDVAKTLKISPNIKKTLQNINLDKTTPYDLMKINDNYGIYVCCFGIFTDTSYQTSQKLKNIFGKIAYVFHILKIWFKQKAIWVDIKTKDFNYCGYCSCLFALNTKYLSGFKINKNADLNDGNIDLFFIKTKSKKIRFFDKIKLFKVYIKGFKNVEKDKNIVKLYTDNIKIKFENEVPINIDGEKKLMKNFEITVVKNKIKFL